MAPVDRSLDSLAPIFRAGLEAWLVEAMGHAQHVDFRVIEARRTLERQRELYAQGRENDMPIVTWTLDSLHRWGLAADVLMVRRKPKQAVWEPASYRWLYRVCPPERYGLRHLGEIGDWLHLEYRYAKEAIAEADRLGLTQS